MALQIDKQTSFGGHAVYWRIGILNIHPRTRTVYCVMDGYLSTESKDAGNDPAMQLEFSIPFEDFEIKPEFSEARSAVYQYLKSNPMWSTAIDV